MGRQNALPIPDLGFSFDARLSAMHSDAAGFRTGYGFDSEISQYKKGFP
jgi:hypothetical protein